MSKLFSRHRENFVCEVCGKEVVGDGYTNHCPFCLCSKHVDINPGDRNAECGGIMRSVAVETKAGDYVLVHKCEKCGFIRKNKVAKDDNFAKVLEICKNTSLPF